MEIKIPKEYISKNSDLLAYYVRFNSDDAPIKLIVPPKNYSMIVDENILDLSKHKKRLSPGTEIDLNIQENKFSIFASHISESYDSLFVRNDALTLRFGGNIDIHDSDIRVYYRINVNVVIGDFEKFKDNVIYEGQQLYKVSDLETKARQEIDEDLANMCRLSKNYDERTKLEKNETALNKLDSYLKSYFNKYGAKEVKIIKFTSDEVSKKGEK